MRILCIDIGGSFMKHTVIDESLQIKEVARISTPRDGLKSFYETIRKIYESYLEIDGIAISTPGVVDVKRGFMYTGGSLDYIRDIDMSSELSMLCDGLPVSIENDAKAAATAELYAGVLKNVKNGVVLTLGTAIGGTIIVDRKILRGKHLFAGEISYAVYHDDGVRDSSWSLQNNMWGFRGVPFQIVKTYGEEGLSCEEILSRFAKGDEKAESAVRTAAKDAALLAHNLQCWFDPDIIAFGGGISAQPEYIRLIKEEAQKINALFHGVVSMPHIEPCRYFNNANLLGAYYAYQHAVKKQRNTAALKKAGSGLI